MYLEAVQVDSAHCSHSHNMEYSTTIRPAKRILILYSLAFLVSLILLLLGLEYLRQRISYDQVITKCVWQVAILLGLLLLAYATLWRLTSVYTISSEFVAATIGILSKNHIRIPMNRIVDYRIITPLLERILGLGHIHIDTAGDDDLIMRQISRDEIGLAVKKLDKLLNKEQRRSDTVTSPWK